MAESLLSSPGSLFATLFSHATSEGSGGWSRAETGLRRKRTGKELEQRRELRQEEEEGHLATVAALGSAEGQIARVGDVEWVPELSLFWLTEPRPQECVCLTLHTGIWRE